MSSTVETLMQMKTVLTRDDSVKAVSDCSIANPAKEVERSLMSFLKHRLTKLQESTEFEETIKNAILMRLPETSMKDLIILLDMIQKNNNDSTTRVLQPFISASGKTITETMREADSQSSAAAEIYENTEDKKVLQSIHAVQVLLDKIEGLGRGAPVVEAPPED